MMHGSKGERWAHIFRCQLSQVDHSTAAEWVPHPGSVGISHSTQVGEFHRNQVAKLHIGRLDDRCGQHGSLAFDSGLLGLVRLEKNQGGPE
jgi:hypothetical protein